MYFLLVLIVDFVSACVYVSVHLGNIVHKLNKLNIVHKYFVHKLYSVGPSLFSINLIILIPSQVIYSVRACGVGKLLTLVECRLNFIRETFATNDISTIS